MNAIPKTRTGARFRLFGLALLLGFSPVTGASGLGAMPQTIQEFSLRDSPLVLERPVQPWNHFTVVGRKAFVVAKEDGVAEIWAVPFKLLHNLRIAVTIADRPYAIPLETLARHIWVRPEAVNIRFVHSAFTIDAAYFTPIEQPGTVIQLAVATSDSLTIAVSFESDLQPMWPGGLGGQYTSWNDRQKAFVITESRRRVAAVVGSPFSSRGVRTPAHAQPNAPVQFYIAVGPGEKRTLPIIAAAAQTGLDDALAAYHAIRDNLPGLYADAAAHYESLRTAHLSAALPDPNLSLAIEWAKASLDKGLIDNPDLGRGLVAGFGPSGKSARPGFAWYFGGDAYVNGWAINDYGGADVMRQALAFLIKYQRDDGKMSHEISQSAAMIPWFEDYPYPYYHADTTPYFLVAMADYLRHSGDRDFIRMHWTAVRKAYDYCRSADANGDGLMDNLKAGLAAVETGKLRTAETEVDIYLASVWTQALRGLTQMSDALGDGPLRRASAEAHERARETLNRRFWNTETGILSFALLTDGSRIDDATPWQAVPLGFDLLEASHADAQMAKMAGPDMATAWGMRSISKSSPKYEYWSYNNGGVWPFMTMYVILGAYQSHFPAFGFDQWQAIANLTFTQQLGSISELFSGDRFQAIEAAVPHQLFSSTPVILGLSRGILGYEPDVPNRILALKPHWPRSWHEATIENLPYGPDRWSLTHRLTPTQISLKIALQGAEDVSLRLSYGLHADEQIESLRLNGRDLDFQQEETRRDRHITCTVPLPPGEHTLTLHGRFNTEPESIAAPPQPGARR